MVRNEEKFTSIDDLYKRVLPALKTKITELKREKYYDITPLDIWNYCIQNKWVSKNDLRIYEIVDDILNVDGLEITIFKKKK